MSAEFSLVPTAPVFSPFRASYAPDDAQCLHELLPLTSLPPEADHRIDSIAEHLITAVREQTGSLGVEEFMREFSLTSREGLALMVLAEALLRVPDALTIDKLIADKLSAAEFESHETVSDAWIISATAWAMGVTAKILRPEDSPAGILNGLVKRLGQPTVRTAALQAMKIMGHQFVLGETIDKAIDRGEEKALKGYRHSYDMLGEGARTQADADRHYDSYLHAVKRIGETAQTETTLPERPGLSIKLSAIHPRYEARNSDAVIRDLVPKLIDLARIAKSHDLCLTIDAEEADRLELSLDIFAAVLADKSLQGWNGFGLAIQAYQKRALHVVNWVHDLAEAYDRQLMVRLVKGAYWDTEIKRAQERGLTDFPVFTRKAATDVSFLACARRMMQLRPRLYPQIATHNALTVAQVCEISRLNWNNDADHGFEFQKLHGMGDALYDALSELGDYPCRIYAPAGKHRDLLAYLVRRLLENGANSSFVNQVGDPNVPLSQLLTRPDTAMSTSGTVRHARIALPMDLFGTGRRNSSGLEFGCAKDRNDLTRAMRDCLDCHYESGPIIDGIDQDCDLVQSVLSPVDGETVVGSVVNATEDMATTAVDHAAAGFATWAATPAEKRAEILTRFGDLLEAEQAELMALLCRESGKTLDDALAEVREAVDFCRYYAVEAERLFATPAALPSPAGESNTYAHRGRGVFVCISPWNFPLAIFTGQMVAALAAGNTVVAKPAGQTPLIAAYAVRLAHQAGVPVTALHFIPGAGGTVGNALLQHAKVAGVVFTGSTATAHHINRTLAAKDGPIVPLIAETGGLNAMIVDATALPEQVTDDVITSAFRSAGQRCSALRLLFLQDDVADTMLDMIKGAADTLHLDDGLNFAADLGPVIDAAAKADITAYIAEAKAEGRVLYQGQIPSAPHLHGGSWIAPTIIELSKASDLKREVFGPVLHVVRWQAKNFDSVLDDIAASGYGLTLGLHSRIEATARQVQARLQVGNIYINRNMIGAIVGMQPFGGCGLSGTGPKAGGPAYLLRFALEQTVTINTAAAGGNAQLISLGED
jgi:RHH-type proline utilization regulon transcriptional repressor/proline dehydrogenase/delta 1-pyrroline-5-carboxylate dehydrogenase